MLNSRRSSQFLRSFALNFSTEEVVSDELSRKRYFLPNERLSSVSAAILAENEEMGSSLTVQDHSLVEGQRLLPPQRLLPLQTRAITQDNQFLKLAEVMTPLHDLPYSKQLTRKYVSCVDFLKNLKDSLRKKNVDIQSNQYGLPCDLLKFVTSPQKRWYRNKDEFVVHVGVDRYTPNVGICIGNPNDISRAVCVEPGHLTSIKMEHKQVAQLFQDYVRSSRLPVCEDLSRNHWRKLLVRSNCKGQLMISATMHPHSLTEFDISQEKKRFVEFLTEEVADNLDLHSVYFQTLSEPPNQKNDGLQGSTLEEFYRPSRHELLWGEPHLEEVQGGLNLRVCPSTSLMENSTVADNFFYALEQALDLKPETTLLDMNCGTGVLGLYLSRLVSRVIGVKTTPGSIVDVYKNAERNGVENISFTQRSLFSVLRQLKKRELSDLVAVVNPSQEPIGREIVFRLKGIPSLRRIVYVTQSLEGRAYKNILLLSQMFGWNLECRQFLPVQAFPVDVYPQTNSYYFVMVFERFT